MIKTLYCFKPIREKHANLILTGPSGVGDLPCTRELKPTGMNSITSVWKVKSFFARINFLFFGKIYFECQGNTHPPISITIGKYINK